MDDGEGGEGMCTIYTAEAKRASKRSRQDMVRCMMDGSRWRLAVGFDSVSCQASFVSGVECGAPHYFVCFCTLYQHFHIAHAVIEM